MANSLVLSGLSGLPSGTYTSSMDERSGGRQAIESDQVSTAAVRSEPSTYSPRARVDPAAETAALAHVRAGCRNEALKVLMTAYGAHIAAFALRVVRNLDIAHDVRQQVFLDAFQGFDKFEGRSSLWSWLCGIAYRRCIDEIRRSRRVTLGEAFDVWEGLEAPPDRVMDADRLVKRRALEECLAKLPVELRTQVLMRCFWSLTHAEIGQLVGAPHGTVQVRISRILPRLQRCLRKKGVAR